jgi:hypothetical protein
MKDPVSSPAPAGIDVTRPHPARMYDYYLGGYFLNSQLSSWWPVFLGCTGSDPVFYSFRGLPLVRLLTVRGAMQRSAYVDACSGRP